MSATSTVARRICVLTSIGVLAAGLAGCGSDDAAPATASGDVDPHASEVDTITAANYRQNSSAPLMTTVTEGIAADYGQEVEVQFIESSAAGLAALVGGDVDMTFSSYTGVVDAARQGIDVRIIAENFRSIPDSLTVEVMPDSPIQGLSDLVGKKVGVVALNSSHDTRIKYALSEEGLDPDSVTFVALPFGEVGAALEQGTIDAGVQTGAPLQTVRSTLGTRPVLDFGAGLFEDYPEGGWITTNRFLEENPNAVAAFQCSQVEAARRLRDTPGLYETVATEQLGFDEAALAVTPMLNYPTELDADRLQLIPDIMLELGSIDEEFDISSIVVPLPDNCD